MKKYTKKSKEERQKEVQELSKKLSDGVKSFMNSDHYKELLKNLSKFHNYSLNNTLLIYLQKPEASYVTTYPKWKSLNRQVKKGEKGIKIFVPIQGTYEVETDESVTDSDGNIMLGDDGEPLKKFEIKRYLKFKIGHVYDISQTAQMEGKEEKVLTPVNNLEGEVTSYEALLEKIEKIAPVPIEFEEIKRDANGYYSWPENRIAIQKGMSQIQTIKTSIHELAHATLHNEENKDKYSRSEKELQAESVAYIVCQHLGIDTSDYSFGYVGAWSDNEKQFLQNLEIIKECSSGIIEKLENVMA